MFNHIPIKTIDIKSKDTPKGRFYQIDKDTKYPSITTILGASGDKEWLQDWRNMLGSKKADKESKRCADRGTAVHKLAEDYLNNVKKFDDNHKIENIKLFNQLKFKLNKIDNIKAQEVALFSKNLEVAGRVDCIADFNGIPSIIDFKTSNKTKIKENIEDYFSQAIFYMIAYNEMYNDDITQLVIMIAVEKSIMPQIFIKQIDIESINKLLIKIKKYKETL
jgi:ATP-dependent exoDNAse (exonuclease V) beta subunit